MVPLNKLPDVTKICLKEEFSSNIDDVITMVKTLEEKVKQLEENLTAPPPTLQKCVM